MKTKIFLLVFFSVLSYSSGNSSVNFRSVEMFPQTLHSDCSEIILKDGTIINATIRKITENTIEYVKCGTTSPVYEISKEKVLMIKYADGRTEMINQQQTKQTKANGPGKTGAVIAFSLSILGLLIFGIPLGITSIIWGILSLNKMTRAGVTGKGFAIAAIVLGVIDIIGSIIALAILI